jgi:hypothetical protein
MDTFINVLHDALPPLAQNAFELSAFPLEGWNGGEESSWDFQPDLQDESWFTRYIDTDRFLTGISEAIPRPANSTPDRPPTFANSLQQDRRTRKGDTRSGKSKRSTTG